MTNIEIKRKISKIVQEARKNSKPQKCLLCDKDLAGLCNSHSVPRFVLKNISENGKVAQATKIMSYEDLDIFEFEKGINNSGTFKYICHNCDNEFFKNYESEEALLGDISDRMLAEIALKNELINISKRSQEIELYNLFENRIIGFDLLKKQHFLDLRDFHEEVNVHKREIKNNTKGAYQILYKELLPFVVPIATQVAVTLQTDMYGYPVNNVYDFRSDVKMQDFHLLIFPLEKASLILAFYHKKNKKYRSLRHQFNSESAEKVKEFLNYIIFAYTENYFINKNTCDVIMQDNKLSQLSKELFQQPNFGMDSDYSLLFGDYIPVKSDEIPNLLLKEWAIK